MQTSHDQPARYYKVFYNHGPMEPLTEAEAKSSDIYISKDDRSVPRYKRFIDGKLHSIVYPGVSDPASVIADLIAGHEGVPAIAFSSPERTATGGYKWREWHMSVDGSIEATVEQEFGGDDRQLRLSRYTNGGVLAGFTDYIYDHENTLTELVHRDGQGTVKMREDVDPF